MQDSATRPAGKPPLMDAIERVIEMTLDDLPSRDALDRSDAAPRPARELAMAGAAHLGGAPPEAAAVETFRFSTAPKVAAKVPDIGYRFARVANSVSGCPAGRSTENGNLSLHGPVH